MGSPWSDEVPRDDSLDDENYHLREVYAHFGVAVYQAQVLEHGVVNLLSQTEIMKEATSQAEYDKLVAVSLTRTLGFLAKRLGSVLATDETLLGDLREAIERRNYLVHRYWRERVQLTHTARGRNRIIEELDSISDHFASIDQRLEAMTFQYGETSGSVSRADVEALIRREREMMTTLDGYLPDDLPDLGTPGQ
jgi:hypothetical protein